MAETANTVEGDVPMTKKGRASKKNSEKKTLSEEKVGRKKRVVAAAESQKVDDEFLSSIREQIDNCKLELRTALQDSISKELKNYVAGEIKRVNRRRKWNNFFHDIVIIVLAVVAVYFGYCLYDVHYFSFLKTECETAGTCDEGAAEETESTAGPVKDATWYLANYRYLFDNIQTALNADTLEAYYLYMDDRKVGEIEPKYLLSMAYNQVTDFKTDEKDEKKFSSEQMSEAFRETFGSTELYVPEDFSHGCESFRYLKDSRSFVSENANCHENSRREIVEKIDRIYEEGEVIYIATIAAIRDKTTLGLYNFDNLFKPVTLGANAEELGLYSESLNRYQYQFKKNGEQYYFAGITKIK